MPRKGGNIGQGNNRNQATEENRGNPTRVPQRGPAKPNNAEQQANTFDLNPHKFTQPSMPQPEQFAHGGKKRKES
jgi:hypothetical protein